MKYFAAAFVLLAAPALAAGNASCPAPSETGTGTTVIGFIPQTDGTFTGVVVRHSSGNAALDKAAVDCVQSWHFDPTDKADQHWTSAGLATIAWETGPDQQRLGRRVGVPHYCQYEASARQHGDTTLGFTISDTGKVLDTRVVAPSGDTGLDAAALRCAERWRYKAAIKDYQPVAVPWSAKVLWSEEVSDGPVVVIEPVVIKTP